jgi:ABC-type spermidine/putrescine transport system permease subunit II
VFQVLAVLPGPIIGLALLFMGRTTVQFANALSSIIYAVTVPISVIGITLSYQRFKRLRAEREAAAPEGAVGNPA